MKRRQQTHAHDRQSAAKYAEIVADLTRLLRLFKQPKSSRQVPLDGMRLLSWSQVRSQAMLGALAFFSHLPFFNKILIFHLPPVAYPSSPSQQILDRFVSAQLAGQGKAKASTEAEF